MRIFLIRHGHKERCPGTADRDLHLSAQGQTQARQVGSALARSEIRPDAYLTSDYLHAREMVPLLLEALQRDPPPPVQACAALTPHSNTETFEELLDEITRAGLVLERLETIAIVGHDPRLSQMLVRLTGARARPFARAECVCVSAPLLARPEARQGQG